MTGELYINGQDVFEIYGVTMGQGFLQKLTAPPPLKKYVSNTSRLKHGIDVLAVNPKVDKREISLLFLMRANDRSDFLAKRKAFLDILLAGSITLTVPTVNTERYHLIYKKSTEYATSRGGTFCKFNAVFDEPNPTNRV